MTEEHLYVQVSKDFENSIIDEPVWIKALAQVDGDEKKAKYRYINLMVEKLSKQQVSIEDVEGDPNNLSDEGIAIDDSGDRVLPNTTVMELMASGKLAFFTIGILLAMGTFMPGLWHFVLVGAKIVTFIYIIVSIFHVLKGSINAKVFAGSLIINISTLAILALNLIYPAGAISMISPITWIALVCFGVALTVATVVFDHPAVKKTFAFVDTL